MATAKRTRGRRQQAWQRIPALLTAWLDVSKAMMKSPMPKEALIPGVVHDEIDRFQGVMLKFSYVVYGSTDDDYFEWNHELGLNPEQYEVCIELTDTVLPRIVKALRRAWREVTYGERAPSFGGLINANGLRECLDAFVKRCRERELAIRKVVEKIEDTKARWTLAIERYWQRIKGRKRRPTPVESVARAVRDLRDY